jgi:Ca2+-dependent lipid-binding protein
MSGAAVSNPNVNASASASTSADANINTNINASASKPKPNTTVTNVASHQPDEPEILQASTGSLVPVIILISIATLGSYILGLFQFSILWTSIFLLLAYNFMFRRLARLRRYHRNALERDVARQRLERHAESAEWLNFIVERLWGVLEPVISVKVTEKVNAALGDVCPSFLDSLMLTEFTLGSSAPSIITARVHPKTQPDVIVRILVFRLTFNSIWMRNSLLSQTKLTGTHRPLTNRRCHSGTQKLS